MIRHTLLALGLIFASVACAPDQDAAETTSPSVCTEAAAHMTSCLGESYGASLECDEALAAEIVDIPCASLLPRTTDQKADGFRAAFAQFACDIGFYRSCTVPQCDAELDEAAFMEGSALPPDASLCAQDALVYQGCGACEYYACRQEEAKCEAGNYLMTYGHVYCERYRLVSEPEASPEAQAWLRRVRRCLITNLDASAPEGSSCEVLHERGFASHAECYVETGFCELTPADWLLVLNTIALADFDLHEALVTGTQCLREWFGGESGDQEG